MPGDYCLEFWHSCVQEDFSMELSRGKKIYSPQLKLDILECCMNSRILYALYWTLLERWKLCSEWKDGLVVSRLDVGVGF